MDETMRPNIPVPSGDEYVPEEVLDDFLLIDDELEDEIAGQLSSESEYRPILNSDTIPYRQESGYDGAAVCRPAQSPAGTQARYNAGGTPVRRVPAQIAGAQTAADARRPVQSPAGMQVRYNADGTPIRRAPAQTAGTQSGAADSRPVQSPAGMQVRYNADGTPVRRVPVRTAGTQTGTAARRQERRAVQKPVGTQVRYNADGTPVRRVPVQTVGTQAGAADSRPVQSASAQNAEPVRRAVQKPEGTQVRHNADGTRVRRRPVQTAAAEGSVPSGEQRTVRRIDPESERTEGAIRRRRKDTAEEKALESRAKTALAETDEINENGGDGGDDGSEPPKKKKKARFIALLILEILLVLVVGAGVFLWFYFDNKYDKSQLAAEEAGMTFEQEDVRTNPDISEKTVETMKGYTTFMIYGVDARNNRDMVKNANADTDIICCINNDTKEIKLVSILRDTFLETTDGHHKKLTDIYCTYGVQESMQTINKCFDLTINQYVTVNWSTVAKIVDAVGGIDIEMSNSEAEAVNDYSFEVGTISGLECEWLEPVGSGTYHLTGTQAAGYCRIRSVGHHDIGRAERQRKVISIVLSKVKELSLSEIDEVMDVAFSGISTNLSKMDILSMATDVFSYNIVENTLYPVKYVDQQDLVTAYVYCTSLADNVKELHKFLYGDAEYEPTPTVYEVSDFINSYRKQHP